MWEVIIVSQGSGWMRGKELKKAVRLLTTARWNSVGLCCGGQLIEFLPRLDYTSPASYDIDKIMVRQSAYSTGDHTFEGRASTKVRRYIASSTTKRTAE
jgi:hypothetical protein